MGNKLRNAMGTCLYCGQQKIIKANDTMDQQDIDEQVTLECACDGAARARNIDLNRKLGRKAVDKVIRPLSPYAADAMTDKVIEMIAHGWLGKLQVQDAAGYKSVLFTDKDGNVIARISRTLTQEQSSASLRAEGPDRPGEPKDEEEGR